MNQMRNELRIAIQNAKKQGISTEEMLNIFVSVINETGEVQISKNGREYIQEFMEVPVNRKMEEKVTTIMHEIGIPANIKGYKHIRTAVIYAIQKPSVLEAITKELYPDIAKMYQTTASRVERAIRHAIGVAWDRGKPEMLDKFFGYTVSDMKGKPTNSEFIAMIVDHLNLQNC